MEFENKFIRSGTLVREQITGWIGVVVEGGWKSVKVKFNNAPEPRWRSLEYLEVLSESR